MSEWDRFRLATQFLTRVRVGEPPWSEKDQAASIRWYGVVGLLVGVVGAAVLLVASTRLPGLVAAALSTAAVLLLTGCFHEDGLADTLDGLGGGVTRERTLEIMRDSRIGTYGAAALGIALLTKIATLGELRPWVAAAALVAGHAVSRASVVVMVATSRYVRDHGTGKYVASGAGTGALVLNVVASAVGLAVLGLAAGWGAALVAIVGAAVGHAVMRRYVVRRLGGYTGDCLGAIQQTSELGLLVAVLAWG